MRCTKLEHDSLRSQMTPLARLASTAALCAVLLAPFGLAQAGAAQAAVDAAKRALERGAPIEAAQHAQAALAVDSRNTAAFHVLLRACGSDDDVRALWSHELAAALGDEQGELTLDRDLAALVPAKDPHVAALARARAAAVAELLELSTRWRRESEKDAERGVVAAWAAGVAREAAFASPALHARARDSAPLGLASSLESQRSVIEALGRKLNSLQASGETAPAIEIALVLRGLGAQAAFEDLQGPPPPGKFGATFDAANSVLDRARAALVKSAQPLTIEQLAAMDARERDEFTRAHESFATPGVALSPNGWYRVETNCGHATLLGAAEVVELHHSRLVNWYGQDPFRGRPGLVRVVPESHGLESEGAPFWWAGGFQGGDVTTLRFACSSIADLGRGLTHELTHRFDGALHPGIPAWLAEGRAVWTAAAYGPDSDSEFAALHASFGTIDDARFRGYGALENLEKLIEGTIDDYRDNYVAGYALFVFLATWHEEGAAPKYAGQLEQYQRNRRSDKRGALASFVAHFCDGAGGRPADFEGFAKQFGEFVSGFYWRDRKPFTKRYLESPGAASPSETVLDEPTWVWSRARAEPWFGQDQAREGARLLERHGDERAAAAAYLWSLAVDEPTSRVELALAALLDTLGKKEGAWVLRHAGRLRDGESQAQLTPSPLLSKLPRTRAWLEAFSAAVNDYSARGAVQTAAALAADHDRVARLLGVRELAPNLARPTLVSGVHPFDAPARNPMGVGWVEDGHTGYERHRVPGLWFVDEREHLHVGRNKPRSASGSADRAAHLHHVFVRSPSSLEAGRYVIRARITPTTSFASGALVLGYSRRDRHFAVNFSGGDYEYAIGDKEEAAELKAIGWSLDGSFERDGGLGGSLRGGEYGFAQVVSSFVLELVVDGSAAHLSIEGDPVGVYHTPTGLEIAGHFGFAVSMGDYRVSELSVRRLDRSAVFGERVEFEGWNLARARSAPFSELLNRTVRGVPRHDRGAFVLCLPEPDSNSEQDVERGLERIAEFEAFRERYGIEVPAFVVTAGAAAADLERLRVALAPADATRAIPSARLLVRFPTDEAQHAQHQALRASGATASDGGASWMLFIDSARCLRVATGFHKSKRLDGALERWIEVFRNR